MSETRLGACEKLYLMVWKNWHVHFYHRKLIACCIVTPFLFSLILVVLRFLIKVENVAVTKYAPITLETEWKKTIEALKDRHTLEPVVYSCFIPRIGVAYAPAGNEFVDNIMQKAAAKHLDNVPLLPFATEKELVRAMRSQQYLAGVVFREDSQVHTDKDTGPTIYPNLLSFSLVFPSELRFYNDSFIGANWRTGQLFDYYNRVKQRYPNANDGGFVGYIREGFAPLQHAVSMAYISLIAPDFRMPKIRMQRFAHISHSRDPLAESLIMSLSFIVLIGFWFPCMCLSMFITSEQEKQTMAFLKTMGISYGLQTVAWIINSFLVLFVASLLVILSLKVHFTDGFAILSKSSWTALTFLLVAYILSSISFSFMVCSFFQHSLAAVVFLGFCWMLTYLPFLITINRYSAISRISISFLPNSALGLIFQNVIEFEEFSEGFNWGSFFNTKTIDDPVSVGITTVILFFVCIPYTIIGLTVHRLRSIWSIMPKRCRKMIKRNDRRSTEFYIGHRRMTKVYEIDPGYKKTAVEVISLNKTIQDQVLVKNVSMNLCEDEITVLMGHNGSGKTVLLLMIMGLVRPTHGTATIYGYDIRKDTDRACAELGISFQESNLIPELTVFAQINFHCRLKGLRGDILRDEVQKYLSSRNLSEKTNVLTCDLTLGLKQYLNVCCALCGDSKFVVLDQPTTGMDVPSRKQVWDLLISEKEERTILITTHSTEEADCLADRIAIMSGGELKCCGSSFFLRNIYTSGNRLIIVKDEHCDTDAVTRTIQKFIPDITPECEIGTELSYRLEEKHSFMFSSILSELEAKLFSLKINSISIREPTLDDVFLNMGSEDPSEGEHSRHSDIMNGRTVYADDPECYKFLEKYERYEGIQLLLSHFRAVFYKRLMFNLHLKSIPLMMLLSPPLFTILSFIISWHNATPEILEPMTFRLTQYPETVTILMVQNKLQDQYADAVGDSYRDLITRMGLDHKMITTRNMLFTELILEEQQREQEKVYNKYLIGASMKYRELTAWFNNFPLHTVPLSLNVLHNAILGAALNDIRHKIMVTHAPLSYAANYHTDDMRAPASVGNTLAVNLTYCISIVWTICIMCMVNERSKGATTLQYICGVHSVVLWFTHYIYDFLRILIGSVLIMVAIFAFGHHSFMQLDLLLYFFTTLIFFGLCILPFYYIMSKLFESNILSYLFIATFNIYGGVTFDSFMSALEKEYTHTLNITESLMWGFRIFPHFTLCSTLLKIFTIGKVRQLCADKNLYRVSVDLEDCKVLPDCCSKHEEFAWSVEGILPELASLLFFGMGSTMLLTAIEIYKFRKNRCFKPPKDNMEHARDDHTRWHSDADLIDDSPFAEQVKVNTLNPEDLKKKPLVLKGLGKTYRNKIIAQRMFLIVDRMECFSMLNINSSTKKSLFDVLIAADKPSYGRAYNSGISLTDDSIYRVYEHIGYCPRIDALMPQYTACEYMKIFGLMRGIPRHLIAPICVGLAKVLGFFTHYKQFIKYFSPGYKRRLSISIALLGNPTIIYMDDPTCNLDMATRRVVWNVISRARQTGTAVLMTSLSTRECERLCTRVGVLTNGRLQCIGNPDDLNRKFSKGYLLKIKIKGSGVEDNADSSLGSNEAIFTPNPYLKVQSFVETEFHNARLKDQRGNLLYFVVPFEEITLSKIFYVVQQNTFSLNIETFSVSSATLSIFFMDLSETERLSENSIS